MSLDAVALLNIADWEPDEDVDARILDDDSVLVFLEIPFESDHEDILDALYDAVGPELMLHKDPRGVLVFPDAAEPESAESYEAAVQSVGDAGFFLELEGEGEGQAPGLDALLGEGMKGMVDNVVSAMGFSSLDEMKAMMESNDPEVQKLAQIKMSNALESSMNALRGESEKNDPKKGEGT